MVEKQKAKLETELEKVRQGCGYSYLVRSCREFLPILGRRSVAHGSPHPDLAALQPQFLTFAAHFVYRHGATKIRSDLLLSTRADSSNRIPVLCYQT